MYGIGFRAAALLSFFAVTLDPCAAWAVVISEIHYHPRAGEENLELVEIANDSSTPEDISGYSFSEGIEFTFPPGTILPPSGFLVVCADAEAVKSHYGLPPQSVLGNYAGKLDNAGEKITLSNHAGIVLGSVGFNDEGKWPVAPDGTGHSLVLRNVHLDAGEPESWTQSPELGGSPGRPNFPSAEPQFKVEVIVDRGALWRYTKGTQPFSTPETAWREPAFDDAGWIEGPSGFGFADGDDATVLDDMLNGYTAVAVRKRFTLAPEQLQSPGEIFLAIDYDDGFTCHVNGKEAARMNCGASGADIPWNGSATRSREAGKEELFQLPSEDLSAGENVLAIAGYNIRITDSDFSLKPRVIRRSLIVDVVVPRPPVVFNELFRSTPPGSGWLEIYNSSAEAADIAGHSLTDAPGRLDPLVFPAGTVIEPHGFLVVEEATARVDLSVPEVQLFLLAPDGFCVTASSFEREWPADVAAPGGFAEARFPDGARPGWLTVTPTRGLANQVEWTAEVVINEIFYHPPLDRRGEFIELFNRGKAAIDLSGFRFDRGITYAFAEGSAIEAGGYLVIAEDLDLMRREYGLEALGPYEGQLADGGENLRLVDRLGNLAAEVRYADGGGWSRWADGGGSSLERIDPRQDGTVPAAWDASDEEAKAPWELLTFHVSSYAPASVSELHLFLAERGVCSIDDVSISRDGGANLIPNPGFETVTAPWIIQGTHVRSRRITTEFHSGAACLELNASGKGDTLVNRIETDTTPAMTRGSYDVSLWARWRRGGSLLLAHGDYTAGLYGGRPSPAINLSGNSMSAGLQLAVPLSLGTPGAENSARKKLREATGSGNLGPVIDRVRHAPATPPSNLPISVTARVQDSDGVPGVQVFYRVGSAAGEFLSAPLLDDGLHGDGDAGDGLHGGEVPGFPARTKVVFYVEAVDGAGAARRFPVDAPARTCLFMVNDPVRQSMDSVRLVLDTARTQELQTRPLHSNDLLDGALVFNDDEVYYNVGARYRSSPWGRPSRANFRVRFENDRAFHRGRRAINLSSRGAQPNEGAAYWFAARNGVPEKPVPAQDYFYVKASINGAAFSTYGIIQPIDRDFLVKWYGDAANGPALKVEGRRQFNDAGDLAGMWDGASFVYKTEDRENYRGYFIPGIRRSIDDWSSFIALSKVMDRKQTPDAAFDAEIDKVLDVEEFLRVFAVRVITADWDAFCVGNGHNGYLVLDPRDGRWELLPFDVDNTFSNASTNLFQTTDGDVARLLNRPLVRRTYFRILEELLDGYWSPVTAKPYLDAVQAGTGVATAAIRTYLTTNVNVVKNGIRLGTSAVFKIVTNAGADITTDAASIELEGEAPVKVGAIGYRRNQGKEEMLDPVWTSPVRWKAAFDLPEPANLFEFTGFDKLGGTLSVASITVISTAQPGAFVRGDVNDDRSLNITDPIAVLRYLFGGASLSCLDAADVEDNGKVDLTDAVGLLEYLFREGPGPAAPYPRRGVDSTEDGLDCAR